MKIKEYICDFGIFLAKLLLIFNKNCNVFFYFLIVIVDLDLPMDAQTLKLIGIGFLAGTISATLTYKLLNHQSKSPPPIKSPPPLPQSSS